MENVWWMFLIAATVVALVVLARRHENKRTRELQAVATDLGFEFRVDAGLLQSLCEFHLFARGNNKCLNMLCKQTENLDVAVFEHYYEEVGGKTAYFSPTKTVICFRFAGPELPTFVLRPRGFFDTLNKSVGLRDIECDRPAFSGRYLLRGNDEDSVRKLFTGPVIDYYAGLTNAGTVPCTEASGKILVYKAAKRIRPRDVPSFLAEGLEVLLLFRPSSKL